MRHESRSDLAARIAVTVGALLPYWRLLTFRTIYVTDDYFASDIFNGELPGRVLMGNLLRHGHWPVWTSQLCSGLPLAGAPADPIGLVAFALLPPAAALDLLVIILLLVAAHGAYALARRFEAGRAGAVLAGIAFAGCGYFACQLKHLAIVSTVAWLPVGLLLVDRALGAAPSDAAVPVPTSRARRGARALDMALFALVFGEQVLCGFPQSAYICGLTYGAFAAFRVFSTPVRDTPWRTRLAWLAGIGAAALLAAAVGAVVLLPLSAAGAISDRVGSLGWAWATELAYWPRNVLTFVVPYINGDISDNSYIGPPFFWEDYGYIGILTLLFGLYAVVREHRRPIVRFVALAALLAYLCVLGRATPVFRVIYTVVPGISLFRFPTRFLIVVELGLALLAAIGLTRFRSDVSRRWPAPSRVPAILVYAVCALTGLDLFIHQPRQNPMVAARAWLSPPPAVPVLQRAASAPRTFTPRHRDLHRYAFEEADGWSDVQPYFRMRDLLDPNLGGGLWNTPSADCYDAIAPRWYVDVWGSDSREVSLMGLSTSVDPDARQTHLDRIVPNLLKAYGVTDVLTRFKEVGADLPLIYHDADVYIYSVPGAARVRFVASPRYVETDREAAQRLLDPQFDPGREVLLDDVPLELRRSSFESAAVGHAAISREDSREIVIAADASADGFLLLADTYYPGWTAAVDGVQVPIYRADLSVRAVPFPRGRHEVRFEYEMPGLSRGLQISLVAMSALLVWIALALQAKRQLAR